MGIKSTLSQFFKGTESNPDRLPQYDTRGPAGMPDMVHYMDIAGNNWYIQNSGINPCPRDYKEIDMCTSSGKALALKKIAPFSSMVNALSELFARGRDYVVDRDNNENFGTEKYDQVRQLIKKPNLFQTSTVFKHQLETYLSVFGYCPVFGLRILESDIPENLWCIPPNIFNVEVTGMFLKQTDIKEIISRAWIETDGQKTELGEEDYFIVFAKNVEFSVCSNKLIVNTPVDTLSPIINNWQAQTIARGAIIIDGGPKGIISNDDKTEFANTAMTEKEKNNLNAQFKEKYGWVSKPFQVLVTTASVKWTPLSYDANQLKLDETDMACMKQICFALRWPYGLFDPSNQYANNLSGEERRAYQTLITHAEIFSESLTEFLNQEDLIYKIDYTHVEALQKDYKEHATTLNSLSSALDKLWKSGNLSQQEYRKILSEYVDIETEINKNDTFYEEAN